MELAEYIGFWIIMIFAATGAYIWGRWGLCGVAALWRFRRVLDETVKDDIQLIIRRGG